MALKTVYGKALLHPVSRRISRSLRHRLLRLLGHRDPFFDLAGIANGPADLLLDLGCFDGQTIQRVRDAGVSCPIVGFDPIPTNLAVAKRNLCNETDVTLVQAAVSDQNRRETFFVNRNEQTSSLLDNDIGNEESVPIASEHVEQLEVSTLTLDKWFLSHGKPDARVVIKCDVQGAEGRVIRGGLQVFKNNVIAFFGEIMLAPMYKNQSSMEELRHLLEDECGLVLFNLYPCFRDESGRAIQTDGLWVRPDCLHLLTK
jgi:FkbM family methyltransferase